MSIRITDTEMVSNKTRHVARFYPDAAADGRGAWVVSWVPLRLLNRNQAITAMTIAEFAADGLTPEDRRWPHVQAWTAELCLTAENAVALVAEL